MKLRMTQHARDRARERGVSARQIKKVLEKPKISVIQLSRKSTKAWRVVDGRKITVVYSVTSINEATVITVYAD